MVALFIFCDAYFIQETPLCASKGENLPDNVVDDDGVRGQEEVGEALRDLRELQPRAVKNLKIKITFLLK